MCFLCSPSSIYNLEANPRLLVAEGFLHQANTNLLLRGCLLWMRSLWHCATTFWDDTAAERDTGRHRRMETKCTEV